MTDDTRSSARPLVMSSDAHLIEDLIRLGAAAGAELSVRSTPAASAWAAAPLVVIGVDAIGGVLAEALPRRHGVVIVSRRERDPDPGVPLSVWQGAVALGAEQVIELPDGERWIVDRLAELSDDATSGGPVISCVPAVGGAGASTLACMLARDSAGFLIDIDTYGAAIPVDHGVRWPDLTATRGRIPTASLSSALPTVHGAHVLTGTPESRFRIPAEALVAVIDAGARGFACTVIDTPRCEAEATRIAWSRSDLVIIVIGPDPASVARVPALVDGIHEVCTQVAVVARMGPRDSGLWCRAESREWDVPLLGTFRHERALGHGDHVFHVPRRTGAASSRAILAAAVPGIVAA
jgi:secretion/DNA translocation related CpaE-like protein